MQNNITQLDRVSYTYGFKMNTGKYENSNVSISYTTDVEDSEKPEDAIKRCKQFVLEQARIEHAKLKQVSNGANKPRSVSSSVARSSKQLTTDELTKLKKYNESVKEPGLYKLAFGKHITRTISDLDNDNDINLDKYVGYMKQTIPDMKSKWLKANTQEFIDYYNAYLNQKEMSSLRNYAVKNDKDDKSVLNDPFQSAPPGEPPPEPNFDDEELPF